VAFVLAWVWSGDVGMGSWLEVGRYWTFGLCVDGVVVGCWGVECGVKHGCKWRAGIGRDSRDKTAALPGCDGYLVCFVPSLYYPGFETRGGGCDSMFMLFPCLHAAPQCSLRRPANRWLSREERMRGIFTTC
jgi:hypothetical protein